MKKINFIPVIFSFLSLTFLYADPSVDMEVNANEWKAGVARVVITPEEPIWMAGYGGRDRPSEGTLHDLWAKALILEDMKGNKVLLISTDLESFPKNMLDRIRNKIRAAYGLTKAQIILNSSHTHSGPVLHGMYNIYTEDLQELKKIKNYSELLEEKIVTLVGEALNSMVPVQIFSANGVARFAVNRRNNREAELNPTTQLSGPVDHSVPVIKVTNTSGDLLAVVFGYACHPTTLGIYQWSGDYPGFAQLELEKLYPGVTALFFQGAGGDQNPLPRRTVALAQQYGRELATAVETVLNEGMRKLSPLLSTAYSEVELQFSNPPTKEELSRIAEKPSGYQKQWATSLLDKIQRGEPIMTSYPYPVQILQLGDQSIISLGGEVVIDYAIEIKRIFGSDIFIFGYSNDVMAYIPSTRILREGGYEGASSQIAWGLPSTWTANIETVILQEVLRLAKQAGVTMPESKLFGN